MKSYSAETFLEILREIVFTNYLTYTCVNAYSDFVYRFIGVINFMVLKKGSERRPTQNLVLTTKLCQQYKDRMNFIKSLNIRILKLVWIILKLLKCTCRNNIEEKEIALWRRVNKNRNKSKELWKALKSLGLSSDKARKSKIYLKKDGTIQFETLETRILSKGVFLN